MDERRTTILTGEPLSWQLTNAQRIRIGLPPVEDSWQLTEIPCGLLSDRETYLYLDGKQIQRVISIGENYYEECCIDAVLSDDGRIAPVISDKKSVPLTAANIHKRRKTNISIVFNSTPGWRSITITDHQAKCDLLDLRSLQDDLPEDVNAFSHWLEDWCSK